MTTVRLSTASQRVTVKAEDRSDVAIVGDARIEIVGDRTTIDRARSRLTVRVPVGTEVVVGTTAGRVMVSGPVGDVGVVTESGRIEIEQATSVDARTTSGRVTVGRVSGPCLVQSESGRIEIAGCVGGEAITRSGRIALSHVDGPVRAHCVSGRIDIQLDSGHDVDAETVSGRISVRLPRGVHAHVVDGPGPPAPLPSGCDCMVRAVSVSGRIEVSDR